MANSSCYSHLLHPQTGVFRLYALILYEFTMPQRVEYKIDTTLHLFGVFSSLRPEHNVSEACCSSYCLGFFMKKIKRLVTLWCSPQIGNSLLAPLLKKKLFPFLHERTLLEGHRHSIQQKKQKTTSKTVFA